MTDGDDAVVRRWPRRCHDSLADGDGSDTTVRRAAAVVARLVMLTTHFKNEVVMVVNKAQVHRFTLSTLNIDKFIKIHDITSKSSFFIGSNPHDIYVGA